VIQNWENGFSENKKENQQIKKKNQENCKTESFKRNGKEGLCLTKAVNKWNTYVVQVSD